MAVGSRGDTAELPRVLVVDDDALIGAVITRILKDYRVTFTQSATGALGRIHAGGSFRAIVCDVMMPGMSGFQFHAELVRIAPDLARRIVLVTGLANSAEVQELASREGIRWLAKPFQPHELREAVAEATRR